MPDFLFKLTNKPKDRKSSYETYMNETLQVETEGNMEKKLLVRTFIFEQKIKKSAHFEIFVVCKLAFTSVKHLFYNNLNLMRILSR